MGGRKTRKPRRGNNTKSGSWGSGDLCLEWVVNSMGTQDVGRRMARMERQAETGGGGPGHFPLGLAQLQ